ncbi:glycoside hydrolase family 3 C-terminal domain-containing protein [Mycena olivaceomarginata]|nr:glycoside hydrolase family 3 C-terminal domain-containing protein [Mycena olivaceomarginata]
MSAGKRARSRLALKDIKRIAIVGSDAGPNPDGANGLYRQGTLAMGWGSGTASCPYLVDPLQAITDPTQSIDPTVEIDAVLNHFNLAQTRARGDCNNITLLHGGEALIAATAAACSNTVVITHTIGSVTVEDWVDNPNVTAVLHAGVPGQETGNAVVEVLFSDSPQATNPSGRLPYTTREDSPADVLYTSIDGTQITYKEELGIDGRWFDIKNITSRFEFGFGLSYTIFGYSGSPRRKRITVAIPPLQMRLRPQSPSTITPSASSLSANVSSASVSIYAPVSANATSTVGAPSATSSPVGQLGGPSELYDQVLSVSFRVQNTGDVAGNEVSQLYLTLLSGYGEPLKVLRGFSRNFLQSGHTCSRHDFLAPDFDHNIFAGVRHFS